jgi:hypothetical protein
MVHRLAIKLLLVIGPGFLLSGCIASHDRVSRQDLPASWRSALTPSHADPDVSGTYENAGQYTHEFSSATDHLAHARLADLLFPGQKGPVMAEQVRLAQHAAGQFEIETLAGGRTIATKTVSIEVDRDAGAVRLARTRDVGAGGKHGRRHRTIHRDRPVQGKRRRTLPPVDFLDVRGGGGGRPD